MTDSIIESGFAKSRKITRKSIASGRPIAVSVLLLVMIATPSVCLSQQAHNDPHNIHSNDSIALDLESSIKSGELIWLMSEESEQFGIFTPSQDIPIEGAAIILHDIGGHPDWPDVIRPLRLGLTQHNWATLSVSWSYSQNKGSTAPTLTNFATPISDAVSQLNLKGLKNIILVGYGQGALAALNHLTTSKNSADQVSGFIAISLNGPIEDSKHQALAQLESLTTQTLDIYGENDLSNVVNTAGLRLSTSRAAAKNLIDKPDTTTRSNTKIKTFYQQIKIPGANHSFNGQSKMLLKRILGWTKRNAQGTTIYSN